MPPRRYTFSQAELSNLIAQSVAAVVAAQNHGGEGAAAAAPPPKPCTYKDFQNCKPMNFAGTEGAVGLVRWIEKTESVFLTCNCAEEDKVKFSVGTFSDTALTWWNTYTQTVGIANAYHLPWEELKQMLRGEYCPRDELKQLEIEFWNHKMQGDDITGYTNRFHQLALLCPTMVDPEYKRIEKYVDGLPDKLQDLVTSSKPDTIQGAIRMAHELTANSVRRSTTSNPEPPTSSSIQNKRKWSDNTNNQPAEKPDTTKTYNYQHQSPTKRLEAPKAYVARPEGSSGYGGYLPHCSNCKHHHRGPCIAPCARCNIRGHLAQDCKFPTTPANPNAPRVCFVCGKSGHFMRDCPERQY